MIARLCLVAVLVVAAPASAQSDDADRAAALALVQTGVQAAQVGDWESARVAFAHASELVTSTRVLMNLAGAQRHTGHLLDAAATYRQWQTLATDRDAPFRGEVDDALAELDREIPQVRVLVEGLAPGDVIALDDARALPEEAVSLDPGAHVVSVTRGSRVLATQSFDVSEGQRRALTLDVPAPVIETTAPPPTRSLIAERQAEDVWSTPWPWVGIGAGAALVIGIIIGVAVATSSSGSGPPDMGTLGPYHL